MLYFTLYVISNLVCYLFVIQYVKRLNLEAYLHIGQETGLRKTLVGILIAGMILIPNLVLFFVYTRIYIPAKVRRAWNL